MEPREPTSSRKPFVRRFGWALIAAPIFLLIALILGISVQVDPVIITYSTPIGFRKFASDSLLSATLAIIVAIATSEIVEKASLRRAQKEYERFEAQARALTNASIRAVARNVWGEDHAAEVFEEILATNFSTHILRQDYLHEYTFECIEGAPDVVKLSNLVEYTTINPAKKVEIFEPMFAADDSSKMYPSHPYIRRPILTGIKIGERVFAQQEIAKLNGALYGGGSESALKGVVVPLGSYKIAPEGRIEVRLTFESVVPIDNQWIQVVGVPTKGLRVVVHNHVGPDFLVFFAPLFRSDFLGRKNLGDDGSDWEQRYDGVILPHSGWSTRWNRTNIDISH